MRLVTWNSQPGIARNWETIQGFGADVLTFQECEPDTKAFVEGHPGGHVSGRSAVITMAWRSSLATHTESKTSSVRVLATSRRLSGAQAAIAFDSLASGP